MGVHMELKGCQRGLAGQTLQRSPALRTASFRVRAFKDDSMIAASGKPGQLRGGIITFKVPANKPVALLPPPQEGSSSSASRSPPPPSVTAAVISAPIPSPSTTSPTPDLSGPLPATLPPALAYQKIAALGQEKANLGWAKLIVLSLLAGMYIAFGSLLMLSVGACCPGLAQSNPGLQRLVQGLVGLPFGLITVLLCGAELFVGNVAVLMTAFWEKKATATQVLRNWIVSYTGNFIGALFIVKLVALTGLAVAGPSAVTISSIKTGLTFSQALSRGILGNWLVCLAVWQATAASSLPGKVIGVFLPISAFVAMGFEQIIANMFMIPLGIAAGADLTMQQFFSNNLIPVTLGNLIGGALCVATPYAIAYGRKTS